jgi:alanyl-tRNA synthetase
VGSHSKNVGTGVHVRGDNAGTWSIAKVRSAFVDYFKELSHAVVPSSNLVLQNDPTLLFANSGMVQFKETFAGTETRSYTRAVSVQKCLRVSGKHNDLDDVGRTRRHHTFFEMLGNFSFGDYFKEDAIKFGWEFVTEVLNLPKNKLWVTVHESDDEAEKLWASVTDVARDRIVRLGDKSNLWSMGEVGPWGYSSEIFYYQGDDVAAQSLEEFLKDDGTYLEIWNLVFMQYYRDAKGVTTTLPRPCIDTGMGLERVAAILEGKKATYDTASFQVLIRKVEELSGRQYSGSCYKGEPMVDSYDVDVSMRVIADHVRAAAFLIADGIAPGNEGHSYVLRRILRRAIRHGLKLGIENPFMSKMAVVLIEDLGAAYPELVTNSRLINELIAQEEEQFRRTLRGGLQLLSRWMDDHSSVSVIDGEVAFQLYDTFGFPLDLTQDIADEHGLTVDVDRFSSQMEVQRQRSRSAAQKGGVKGGGEVDLGLSGSRFVGYEKLEGESVVTFAGPVGDGRWGITVEETPFYSEMGGQVGDTGVILVGEHVFPVVDTVKRGSGILHIIELPIIGDDNEGKSAVLRVDADRRRAIEQHHSATHLFHYALRQVLGVHVAQRGSLVTPHRLRFDFSHFKAIGSEELFDVVSLVNQLIRENSGVETEELSYDKAIGRGALAFFGDKYGETVRVVSIGDKSIELCGGTHTHRSGDVGGAVILSEGSIASGVRRIEAVVGGAAVKAIWDQNALIQQVSGVLKGNESNLLEKVNQTVGAVREIKGELKQLQNQLVVHLTNSLLAGSPSGGTNASVPAVIYGEFEGVGRDVLTQIGDAVISRQTGLSGGAVSLYDGKEQTFLIKSKGAPIDCSIFASRVREEFGVKGGGNSRGATLLGVTKEVAQKLRGEIERESAQ